MIAGVKKALHQNKAKDKQPQNEIQSIQANEAMIAVAKAQLSALSMPAPQPGGFTCWNPHQCGLCRRFLDPSSVLDMFTSEFIILGTTLELLSWSHAGSGCPLSTYLCLQFIEETEGQIPLNGKVVARWNTRDTTVEGGRKDDIRNFKFELSGGGHAWGTWMNCYTNEGELSSGS